MDLFYDREGKPIPTLEWARLYEDYGYRFLAKDQIEPDYVLTTIWEGVNHSVLDEGPGPLFVTGLLREDGDELTLLHEWRWETDSEATAGHTDLLAKLSHGDVEDFLATQEQD